VLCILFFARSGQTRRQTLSLKALKDLVKQAKERYQYCSIVLLLKFQCPFLLKMSWCEHSLEASMFLCRSLTTLIQYKSFQLALSAPCTSSLVRTVTMRDSVYIDAKLRIPQLTILKTLSYSYPNLIPTLSQSAFYYLTVFTTSPNPHLA